MKKTFFITIILVLVIGNIYFIVKRDETRVSFEIFKIKEVVNNSLCSLKGDEWVSCGYGRFGPCGCKKMYKDGGNLCQDDKDCISGVCTITTRDKPDANGLFVGSCPQSDFNTGCGYAEIENGKITKDMRNCLY